MSYSRVSRVLALCFVCLGLEFHPSTLREEAQPSGRLIGSAARSSQLSEPAYAATLAREFNMLEPEDELKWEVIHPAPNQFDFLPADRLVLFAETHRMKVRGHTLLWQRQLPRWLENGNFTSTQLRSLLEKHIRTVVSRYRGRIFAWDVVNEAFDENGQLRHTLWYDDPGIDAGAGIAFIEQAFRWAHAADPDALLFLNEAEAETINRKSDAIYKVVQTLQKDGVPLHGIGLQMHIFDLNPDFAGIAANIHRFALLGLQIHITEMDVAVPVTADRRPLTRSDADHQAQIYQKIAAICFAEPACTALQTWGFTDRYSWVGSSTHGAKGSALLFDDQYIAKPAYFQLLTGIQAARPAFSRTTGTNPSPTR